MPENTNCNVECFQGFNSDTVFLKKWSDNYFIHCFLTGNEIPYSYMEPIYFSYNYYLLCGMGKIVIKVRCHQHQIRNSTKLEK